MASNNAATANLLLDATSDPDAWDDSALIAAYDETVRRARDLALGNGAGARQKKQQQQQRQQKQQQRNRWKVGDLCRAVWSEDLLVYRARILELHDDGAQECICTVEYTDYGNVEQQRLADLMPPDEAETDDAEQQPLTQPPPPPPPLPKLPAGALAEMDEATYNMLMSWYMSGYHTGYYVGRKAAR